MSIHSEARRFARLLRQAEAKGVRQYVGWWANPTATCFCAGGAVAREIAPEAMTIGYGGVLVVHFPSLFERPSPGFDALKELNDRHRLSFSEIADFLSATPAWAWAEATRS